AELTAPVRFGTGGISQGVRPDECEPSAATDFPQTTIIRPRPDERPPPGRPNSPFRVHAAGSHPLFYRDLSASLVRAASAAASPKLERFTSRILAASPRPLTPQAAFPRQGRVRRPFRINNR